MADSICDTAAIPAEKSTWYNDSWIIDNDRVLLYAFVVTGEENKISYSFNFSVTYSIIFGILQEYYLYLRGVMINRCS